MAKGIVVGWAQRLAGREAALMRLPRPRAHHAGATRKDPIRVIVAETHVLMRESLRALLEAVPDITVAGEAADLALTRQHVFGHRPDVLVLDARMPDGSSMLALGELRAQMPGTHVVVVGADDTPAVARLAISAGASGYVLKERAAEDLPDAVRAAAAGREYVSAPLASRLRPPPD